MFCKEKSAKQNFFLRGDFRPLQNKNIQGFQISKNIGYPTFGSGGKKTVKRYLKGEQADKQTNGQTDRQTYGQIDL